MNEKLLQLAKSFIFSDLNFQWTEKELALVNKVFTNANGRVFFIRNVLPANMIAVLLAIYSRMKNPRGLRGTFVDNFLPHVLAGLTNECQNDFAGDPAKFLIEKKLNKLDKFINYSSETKKLYKKFIANLGDEWFLTSLSGAQKMKNFLFMWLDKYGHNSIARPAMVYLCFEQISILAAKSIEWSRPGAGYIELSTRYVDMHGKDVYPIEKELEVLGLPNSEVEDVINENFKLYRELQGENYDGPFPNFLREYYKDVIPADKMEPGVIGETCDVLGNLLPSSTLTSVGCGISGEALPEVIKHLHLDNTPENEVICEMVLQEAEKVGADQFLRHLDSTNWKKSAWEYLANREAEPLVVMPDAGYIENLLYKLFIQKKSYVECRTWSDVISKLKDIERGKYDKLLREFETVTAVFQNKMSYRSWRDLQRMGFCTHRRGFVNPDLGFYNYDKPCPEELKGAFNRLHQLNVKLYKRMAELNIPDEMKQYPMALGNMVKFLIAGNLRQMEFCNWQRSKPTVNHEARQIFLWMENELRNKLEWWKDISRADITPAYVFARGDSDVALK